MCSSTIKISLITFILTFASSVFGQTYNGWNLLLRDTDQKRYFYNVKGMTTDNWPPSIVRTAILIVDKDGKTESNLWWDFNCQNKSIKNNENVQRLTNTTPISIINDGNTTRKLIMQLLCGFQVDDKHWVHYFSILGDANNSPGYLFVNVNDLSRISFTDNNEKKEGIEITQGFGTWDYANFNNIFSITNVGKSIYRCSESKIYSKEKDNYVGTNFSIIEGSGLAGFHYNICQGIYSKLIKTKNTQSQPVVSQSVSNIDDAKKKCSDLGFKSGTEGFGKCVLQLSK
jgi:hypothetical protein